jgi:hypothetical protein
MVFTRIVVIGTKLKCAETQNKNLLVDKEVCWWRYKQPGRIRTRNRSENSSRQDPFWGFRSEEIEIPELCAVAVMGLSQLLFPAARH